MAKDIYIPRDRYGAVTPLFIGREVCKSGHKWGPAVRHYWLLHFVMSGRGCYEVNGRHFPLSAGEAFIIKPDEVVFYKADAEQPWSYLWAAFTADLQSLEQLPYIIKSERLAAVAHDISNTFPENDIAAVAASWRLIGCLCDSLEATDQSYPARAKACIHRMYANDVSVRSLADMLGLERSYFSHVFKRDTGVSPGRYLFEYRMKKAAELLSSKNYTVSVVAASVGYGDVFTFSRSFKKYYGISPSEYKAKHPAVIKCGAISN